MRRTKRSQSGAGLIVIILIIAFLAAVGIMLLSLTGTGSKISGSFRLHDEAFNAAEAGFDAARKWIENQFIGGSWASFAGHYLTQPTGIDLPLDVSGAPNAAYFRRKTDQELLAAFDTNGDGTPDITGLLFFQQTFAKDGQGYSDPRYAYTVFLIDEKKSSGKTDPTSALLVAIGTVRDGNRVLDSVRLEVQIGQ